MFSYKGRELKIGEKIATYKNLNNNSMSIKSMSSNLVVAHGKHFLMRNCTFKVSEAGRQRVLKEQRKNVHAMVVGEYVGSLKDIDNIHEHFHKVKHVSYNPYQVSNFYCVDSGELIAKDRVFPLVYVGDGGVFVVEVEDNAV